MEPALLGLLLLCAAVVLSVAAYSHRRMARHALSTEPTTVAELLALYSLVTNQVDAGLFAHRVGLQGTVECDEPLVSELSHTPCVAFRYRMERHWEEDYEERDAEGHLRRGVRSGSDKVAANERHTPFWLRDATGRLRVLPDGARIEMEKTTERFEPHGSIQIPHPWPIKDGRHYPTTRRTIGYQLREEIVPIGRTIYVLGVATDYGGSLTISKDAESSNPFLISFKSREAIIQTAQSSMLMARTASIACASLGTFLLLLRIFYRR